MDCFFFDTLVTSDVHEVLQGDKCVRSSHRGWGRRDYANDLCGRSNT